jgi:hypothetical protein
LTCARRGVTAQDVEAAHQILRQRAVARHFGAGAGAGRAPGAAREHPRGGDQIGLADTRAGGGDRGRKARDRLFQLGKAIDKALHERLVIEPFLQDHVDHSGQQRRVLAGLDRQMDMRERRDIALPRIGDDQLEATRDRIAQPA